jgi:hypothetical protein
VVGEIAYVRCIPVGDAFKAERKMGGDVYHGYATGEYP